jgi:putative glutamine amidotransferase
VNPGGRPLIGVSTSELREQAEQRPQGEPPRREMALGIKYLRAIEAAGGLPVVMPPLAPDAVGPLVERLAGVCLSGGPDLSAESYGAKPHPALGPTEPELDLFELAVALRADELGLPLLAVCRGCQALNVARGGSLYQDLPDEHPSTIQHRQSEYHGTSHAVDIAPDSRLARALGATRAEVNSFHHQAVKALGQGLRAVAWAPDGVIEGIEAPDRSFVLGVQWHAEGIVDRPEQARLFRDFVSIARDGHAPGTRSRAA